MAAGYDDGDGGSKVAVVMMTMIRPREVFLVFAGKVPPEKFSGGGEGSPEIGEEDEWEREFSE
ncbi:hypothetical protein Tco_1372129, partial [Tanacetum coccineum]